MVRSLENLPAQHEYETKLPVLQDIHSIDSLRQPFLQTHYAEKLAANPPRFFRYVWDDVEKFKEKFGPDVDPVQHGPYQARTIAIPMIEAQRQADNLPQLSAFEEAHFVALHVVHDDHEGITGDTDKLDRTIEMEHAEFVEWKRIITEIHGEAKTAEFISMAVLFMHGDGGFKADFWEASEVLGYYESGVRAWLLGDEDGLTDTERKKALTMGYWVVAHNLRTLESVRDKIAHVDEILISTADIVGAICKASDITRQELML